MVLGIDRGSISIFARIIKSAQFEGSKPLSEIYKKTIPFIAYAILG
jgi:hypothetical protein